MNYYTRMYDYEYRYIVNYNIQHITSSVYIL